VASSPALRAQRWSLPPQQPLPPSAVNCSASDLCSNAASSSTTAAAAVASAHTRAGAGTCAVLRLAPTAASRKAEVALPSPVDEAIKVAAVAGALRLVTKHLRPRPATTVAGDDDDAAVMGAGEFNGSGAIRTARPARPEEWYLSVIGGGSGSDYGRFMVLDRLRVAFTKACGARPDAAYGGMGSGAFARVAARLFLGSAAAPHDADLVFIRACLRSGAGRLGTNPAALAPAPSAAAAAAGAAPPGVLPPPFEQPPKPPSEPDHLGDPAFRSRSLDLCGFADAILLLAEGAAATAAAAAAEERGQAAPSSPAKHVASSGPKPRQATREGRHAGKGPAFFAAGLVPVRDKRAVLEAAAVDLSR